MLKTIGKKFAEWAIVALLFGGLLYAAMTSWQNDTRLKTVSEDIKGIKRSMIAMLLEPNPNKSEIIKGLVSNASFSEGINKFRAGNYAAAIQAWGSSASSGNQDSLQAISVATAILKQKAQAANLSTEERTKIQKALQVAGMLDAVLDVEVLEMGDKARKSYTYKNR
jgi:hypothetical protein